MERGKSYRELYVSDEDFEFFRLKFKDLKKRIELEYTEERYFFSCLYKQVLSNRPLQFAANEKRTKIVYNYPYEGIEHDDLVAGKGLDDLYTHHLLLEILETTVPDLTYFKDEGFAVFLGFEYAFDKSHKTVEQLVNEKGVALECPTKYNYEHSASKKIAHCTAYYGIKAIEAILEEHRKILPDHCRKVRENIDRFNKEFIERRDKIHDEDGYVNPYLKRGEIGFWEDYEVEAMEEERKKHEKKSYFKIIKENTQELVSKLTGKNKKGEKKKKLFKDRNVTDEIFEAYKDVEAFGGYTEVDYTEERNFFGELYHVMMDDRGPRFVSNEARTKIVCNYPYEDKAYDDFSEQGIKELYALHMFLDITGTTIPDLTYIHHEGYGAFIGLEYAFDRSYKTIEELVNEKGIEFRYASNPKEDYEYYVIGEHSRRNGYYKRQDIEAILEEYSVIFPEHCKRIKENIAKWNQEVEKEKIDTTNTIEMKNCEQVAKAHEEVYSR